MMIRTLSALCLLLLVFAAYAKNPANVHKASCQKTWHPVIAVGAGIAINPGLGEARAFAGNNLWMEFFNYSAERKTQTTALFDIFLGEEYRFYPQWALQLGLSYTQTDGFKANGRVLQGLDTQSADYWNYSYSLLTRQVLAEAKLLYKPTAQIYRPYFLFGLGAAFNQAYNYSSDVGFLAFTRMYKDHNTTAFSYRAGIGVDFAVGSHYRLGIGYRFSDLGKARLGIATIDTTTVAGTLPPLHMYAHELVAQFTFSM